MQFISGHGNFKAKLAFFRLIEDPWCTTSGVGVEETGWHVLPPMKNNLSKEHVLNNRKTDSKSDYNY